MIIIYFAYVHTLNILHTMHDWTDTSNVQIFFPLGHADLSLAFLWGMTQDHYLAETEQSNFKAWKRGNHETQTLG